MKAYRDGQLRVFRIEHNVPRLKTSAARTSHPPFQPEEVRKLVLSLLSADAARWLPRDRAADFVCIRSTIIGTSAQLGVQAPEETMLFIVLSYMPPLDEKPGVLRFYCSPKKLSASLGRWLWICEDWSQLWSLSGGPQGGGFSGIPPGLVTLRG